MPNVVRKATPTTRCTTDVGGFRLCGNCHIERIVIESLEEGVCTFQMAYPLLALRSFLAIDIALRIIPLLVSSVRPIAQSISTIRFLFPSRRNDAERSATLTSRFTFLSFLFTRSFSRARVHSREDFVIFDFEKVALSFCTRTIAANSRNFRRLFRSIVCSSAEKIGVQR